MAVETTGALARLGDPVELVRAQDVEELRPLTADPSIDLVLFDRLDSADAAEMLAAILLLGHGTGLLGLPFLCCKTFTSHRLPAWSISTFS